MIPLHDENPTVHRPYVTLGLIDRLSPQPPVGRYTFEFPKWLRELEAAGFADFEAFAYNEPLIYSQDAWRGRVRANARVAPVMEPETLARFDTELAAALQQRFPSDPFAVDHRIFALVLTKPQEA